MITFGSKNTGAIENMRRQMSDAVSRYIQSEAQGIQITRDLQEQQQVNAVIGAYNQARAPQVMTDEKTKARTVKYPGREDEYQLASAAVSRLTTLGKRGQSAAQQILSGLNTYARLFPERDKNVPVQYRTVMENGTPKTVQRGGLIYLVEQGVNSNTSQDIPNLIRYSPHSDPLAAHNATESSKDLRSWFVYDKGDTEMPVGLSGKKLTAPQRATLESTFDSELSSQRRLLISAQGEITKAAESSKIMSGKEEVPVELTQIKEATNKRITSILGHIRILRAGAGGGDYKSQGYGTYTPPKENIPSKFKTLMGTK
jgi:hypothetical protein